MTVEYNSEVATVTFSGFLKLLIKWRGSIYKLLWKEFLIFVAMYVLLAVAYKLCMGDEDQRRFQEIVEYCSRFQENIPISFILGFYVNAVVSRWWEQFNQIPWPSKLSLIVTSHIRGQDERSRMIRRTLMRYVSLGYVMTMSSISIPVKKRFPTTTHLIEAGFMLPNEYKTMEELHTPHSKYFIPFVWASTLVGIAKKEGFMLPNEHKTLEELHTPYNKYYIPFVWASTLVGIAKKEGRISSDSGLQAILDEINAYRDKAQNLFNSDWVTIPLVYTQVATIAVYMFFLSCLMSRQNIPEVVAGGDMLVPVFTLLQFFFYVGWLKVAEELLNPFGEDDDDFDINSLIDRNLRTSYLIVDEMHEHMPELVKDQYWDKLEVQIPYTEAALQHYKEAPLGSAEGMQIPEKEQQFVEEAASKLSLIEEDEEAQPEKIETPSTHGIVPIDVKAHDATHGPAVKPRAAATRKGSTMSLASQLKEKLTHISEPKSDIKVNVEESEVSEKVSKEDTVVDKDATDTPKSQNETGEEQESRAVSAAESAVENNTSEGAATLISPQPDESSNVVAEKAEKLKSPPPEKSKSDGEELAANDALENERFINSILGRLRKIRGSNE